jgi:hypothetical protein
MRKLQFTFILFSTLFSILSKGADITVKPQTKEVLVYLQNAQINAVAEVNLVPGMYNIVLEDLSQFLDENSVQIKGDADFTIASTIGAFTGGGSLIVQGTGNVAINKDIHLLGLLGLAFVENARRIDSVYACAFLRAQTQNPRRN